LADQVYVEAAEVRRRFNKAGYQAQLERGELVEEVIYSEDPGPCAPKLPPGSKSEVVVYFTNTEPRHFRARVHRYRKPDHSIWRRPDPNAVYVDGVRYEATPERPKRRKRGRSSRRRARRDR